jgi:hypothetical protein
VTLGSVVGPILSDLCDLRVESFLIGILHTEIAKAAKTDRELGTFRPVVGPNLSDLSDLRVNALF